MRNLGARLVTTVEPLFQAEIFIPRGGHSRIKILSLLRATEKIPINPVQR
jgi:hypothetical protein